MRQHIVALYQLYFNLNEISIGILHSANLQYAAGKTYRVRTVALTRPKHITVPSGSHNDDPEVISGITPTAAALAVRKIGLILRFPAAMDASFNDIPFACSS